MKDLDWETSGFTSGVIGRADSADDGEVVSDDDVAVAFEMSESPDNMNAGFRRSIDTRFSSPSTLISKYFALRLIT